jgi:hypothetical protein
MDDRDLLAATEATFAYHTGKHYHSFLSMDCTNKIMKKQFDKKFTCFRQLLPMYILLSNGRSHKLKIFLC